MPGSPVIVSLPIADRSTSHRFYSAALGLATVGEPAADGIPEPLQFAVNDGLRLMLVPSGGFGWVIGDHEVADRGRSECVLGLTVQSPAEVHRIVEQAQSAGARIVTPPAAQPWGYAGTFADPDGHLWLVTAA
ncbi:VOC family protein [Micromonospora sp. NPDC007271]|uniref:VOC family protein n=1 Tax=Micromonospora sp. NPDC007271 TaxID=3154587 RepID=UPI0033F2E523